MSLPLKILWSEGLAVGPQQFQQQDRYHEARLHQTARSLNANLWGINELKWRTEDLASNCLRAELMSLIFQDGAIYDAPASDLLPPPVDLNMLAQDTTTFTFHVALPMLKPYGGNVHTGNGAADGARYAHNDADTPDLFSDSVNMQVAYLSNAVHLIPHLAPLDSYVHFPVVRLRRVVGGGFEIDQTFMPPSLSMGPASGLPLILENLLSKLKTKIEALYSRHRLPNKDVFEFQSGDVSSFLMLHLVSSASATLADYAASREHHPRRLFESLLTLAGGLLSFSNRYRLADLPKYNHGDPAQHFGKLNLIIRDLIDTVISSKYFVIALSKDEKKSLRYRGTLDPVQLGHGAELCLAVNADMPALELVAAIPKLLKIASPDDVETIVASALPGLELVHMAQVQAAIPIRPNTYYFSVKNKGMLYENMLKAQAVAIYAPASISGLKLELLATTD